MPKSSKLTYFLTKMNALCTPPMSPRLPGTEIKTKHKEAMRQLQKYAKIAPEPIQKYYGLGQSTVRKVLQYESPERARSTRTGRPRESLDKQEVEEVIAYISTDHATRELNWQQIINERKLTCSTKTLKRRCAKVGYFSCI
jgi:hypothetical protein